MRTKTKFSIRDILWLTTLVAVLLGWFLHDRSWWRLLDRVVNSNLKDAQGILKENDSLRSAYETMDLENQDLREQHRTVEGSLTKAEKTLQDSIQVEKK